MRHLLSILILLFSPVFVFCQGSRINAPGQIDRPYVILISMDGFRWDYVQRFQPPHLSRLIAEGTQASSLIPSFPSKTFPNHYTIATGMLPSRHGLVNNSFYDAEKDKVYRISDREVVEDGSWYGGTPLWVNAEQNGMLSASFFFVGSEADIQGIRPTYWRAYDGSVPNEDRIAQVLNWLKLPAPERPHLVTLYFSDMDDIGHRVGPNRDAELRETLLSLDNTLGQLFEGVRTLDLPVHIILVSDHGMAEVSIDEFLHIEPLTDESQYQLVNNGALVHLYLQEKSELETVLRELREKEKHFRVFKAADFPLENYRGNERIGDLVIVPDYPYYFSTARRIGVMRNMGSTAKGEHGFDPAIPDLHGIFYAWGPRIKTGNKIPSIQNIHIYPLVCELLGLPIPSGIDGKAEVLAPILKN